MSEDKRQHLIFIQNVITRMNTNSFQLKGWNIVIVSAILAIFASTGNEYFLLAAIFSTTIFWFLDTYYLLQERKFRGLYDDVAEISENQKDIKLFAMRPDLYTKKDDKKYSFCNVFWSPTVFNLYFPIIIGLFVFFSYFKCN